MSQSKLKKFTAESSLNGLRRPWIANKKSDALFHRPNIGYWAQRQWCCRVGCYSFHWPGVKQTVLSMCNLIDNTKGSDAHIHCMSYNNNSDNRIRNT